MSYGRLVVGIETENMEQGLSDKQVLLKAAAYCAQSEHCTLEVVHKLNQWGVTSDSHEAILAFLEKEGYLDNQRYADAFVRDKFRYNKWGKVKIARALREKEVEREFIEHALSVLDDEDYRSVLLELLKGKQRTLKSKSTYEEKQKLIRFALGRGFEMKEILKCLSLSEDMEYGFDDENDS